MLDCRVNFKIWLSVYQAEISKCVVKKDFTPEQHWLSSAMESLKYFLTTMYIYIMKEPWTSAQESSTSSPPSSSSSLDISDQNLWLLTLGTEPADISLLLNGHLQMFHQHCVIRWVCMRLPFSQRVVTLMFKSINDNAACLSHFTSSTYFIYQYSISVRTTIMIRWCLSPMSPMGGSMHSSDELMNVSVWWSCEIIQLKE